MTEPAWPFVQNETSHLTGGTAWGEGKRSFYDAHAHLVASEYANGKHTAAVPSRYTQQIFTKRDQVEEKKHLHKHNEEKTRVEGRIGVTWPLGNP